MSYCIQADIIKVIPDARVNSLAQDSSADTAEQIAVVVAQLISDADDEINSYLARQYDLPLDETPPMVKKLSIQLSICNLLAKKSLYTDEYKARREWAEKLLLKLSTGAILLQFSDSSDEEEPDLVYLESDTPEVWE